MFQFQLLPIIHFNMQVSEKGTLAHYSHSHVHDCYAALLPRRGRILRRTLSVRLSVRPSRYRYRTSRRAT